MMMASILMGCNCKRDCLIALIMLNSWLWHIVDGSSSNRDSLDSFLYDYAFKKIKKLRSGEVYSVPPPANFSGMELAVARVRTSSLWRKGLSHGPLSIPLKTLPWPFTKRVDVVYQNLGNWSSLYYNVPHHTFLAPVLGFLPYDSSGNGAIEIRALGDEHLVMDFKSYEHVGGAAKCVKFDGNGTMELSSTTSEGWWVVRGRGHFSLVVPNERKRDWEWWMMGVVLGGFGVILVVLGFLWKKMRRRKMKGMEEESERSEGLECAWIGRSRMPFASAIRTQPVLENSHLP
ncbi:uncharacterized protein LOC125205409 [Salvia hispanica]|uniref:uncharacterized protein LOC125205409 n=1 Tax=Salvia hispanica TaxID=49212 RepID=UPI0020095D22|nr:uncharacterized protein LOC125205409 [Salvia hispanica]